MIKQAKAKTKPVKQNKGLDLDFDTMKKAALMLRAMNHKLRQQILNYIHKSGEVTVSEIYQKLKIEQSVTSSHLAIMRKAGFVNFQREGQNIFYSVNYDKLHQLEKSAKDMIK